MLTIAEAARLILIGVRMVSAVVVVVQLLAEMSPIIAVTVIVLSLVLVLSSGVTVVTVS